MQKIVFIEYFFNSKRMFAREMIENAGIDWKYADKFNGYLDDLKEDLEKNIVVEGDLKKSDLAWKIAIYSQSMRYRILELSESCIGEWEQDRFVSCFILARSLIETIAALYELDLRLEEALLNKNLGIAHEIIMNRTFSTRLEDLYTGRLDCKAINIITVIDKINKEIEVIREEYDEFSEYSHVNYFGVFGAYAKLDYDTGSVDFSNQNNKHDVFMRLSVVFTLLGIAKLTFDKLDIQITMAANLSELNDT